MDLSNDFGRIRVMVQPQPKHQLSVMADTHSSATDFLAGLLRSRITFNNVDSHVFPPGHSTHDEIITTHRFILLLDGTLQYKVEGTSAEVKPGHLIFVPAWVRRVWQGPRRHTCRLLWCEFLADDLDWNLHTLFVKPCRSLALEKSSLTRLLKLWPGIRIAMEVRGRTVPTNILSLEKQLQLEGELKAMMARFWPGALPWNEYSQSRPISAPTVHPELKTALQWINEHFLEPDVIDRLYKEIDLSPNHFRLLFRQTFRSSPHDYVNRLRLRRARYLVHDTTMPIKQIAAFVGYTDPLFFSRQYHLFWGHSPRGDRQAHQQ